MDKARRKHYSPAEKVALLREVLIEKRAVSELCDAQGIHPVLFYRWQKEFFEQGHRAFERAEGREEKRTEKQVAELEAKLRLKDEVIGELMAEYVALKKRLGER